METNVFLFRTYSPRVFWGHQMDRRSHQAGQMENVGVHLPIFFEFVYFPKMKPTYQIYTATGCLMTLWFFLKCMKIYLVYRWKEVYTAACFCSSTCKHVRLPQYALYEFLQMVWASVHFRIHDCTIGLIYLALWQSFHYKYRAHNQFTCVCVFQSNGLCLLIRGYNSFCLPSQILQQQYS